MAKRDEAEKLFPAGYWDRPSPRKTGDGSAVEIFAAVGEALSNWEMAEEILAQLAQMMSETNTQQSYLAVREIFGSIESSAGRRSALEKLYPLYFVNSPDHPECKARFRQLLDAFSSGARLRDDLAHGIVSGFSEADNPIGCFLIPTGYNSGRNHPFPKRHDGDHKIFGIVRARYRYTSEDIREINGRYRALIQKSIETLSLFQKENGVPQLVRQTAKTEK